MEGEGGGKGRVKSRPCEVIIDLDIRKIRDPDNSKRIK